MLFLTRTPRFCERVPEDRRAAKAQIIFTNFNSGTQQVLELRSVMYKKMEGKEVPVVAEFYLFSGDEKQNVAIHKNKAETINILGEDAVLIVKDIDNLDRVEIGISCSDDIDIVRGDI